MPADRAAGASASGPRRRLAWLAVARSPYNDFLFSQLARHYDLTVVYQRRAIATHPWELGEARYPILHVREDLGRVLATLLRADATVVSGWNDPAYLALLPLVRRPRAFWTDTPDTRPRSGARGALRGAVIRTIFARFDEIWSTGAPGRRTIEAMGCDPRKTRELPFFLDLDRLAAVSPERREAARRMRDAHGGLGSGGTGQRRVVFLGAGQLAAKKRYGDAIDALAAVPGAVLWLCGTGPDAAALEERARASGVADRVVFHGWVQPDAMELAYLAADVFVHPAARDPFPTVVLDAMTWAKPVIGSDVSGSVLDRVTDGVEGFVVREGDVSTLAARMRHFVETPAEIERMGRAARARAERYPVTLAFERVDALIARALTVRGR